MTKPIEQGLFAPIMSLFGSKGTPAIPTPNIPAPPPPAQSPSGARPTAKAGQTQLSYLTAASRAAAAGQGGRGGKTLLGQ